MNWTLFWTFVILNVVNVIIQTVKSIATIKCGKLTAAVVNAIAYGLYTVVVVYTVCELSLWLKVVVVALTNLLGVYIVKLIEEKSRKDKLWLVQMTIPSNETLELHDALREVDIPHNFIENVGKYSLFNVYCNTQQDSIVVKAICDEYGAKYFVSESKIL